jgi:hypothetical protein
VLSAEDWAETADVLGQRAAPQYRHSPRDSVVDAVEPRIQECWHRDRRSATVIAKRIGWIVHSRCSRIESGTYVPICRRIRPPHADEPGEAQSAIFGSPDHTAFLEARHRHAGVKDYLRCGRATGLDHFPPTSLRINAAWCVAATIAADLLAW